MQNRIEMASTGKRKITLTTALWLVLMTAIVVIVAFCHFPDGADWKWCIPLEGRFHIPMMLAGAALVGLIAFVCFKCCKGSEIRRGRLLAVSGIITVVQIVLMYSYYVHTNWDVQQVTGLAKAMATGSDIDEFSSYFRWNPNNLFLSRIFAAVFFLTGPLWGMKVTLFPLLVLQSVGACLTALMLVQTAMHIWHRKDCAILTYVLYLLLVWMSPWWSIPYSDIWGLMVAVAILWTATTLPFKRLWLKLMILGAATVVGYYIRPQTVFVPLAMVIVGGLEGLKGYKGLKGLKGYKGLKGFKGMLRPSGFVLAGIASGFIIVNVAMIGCPLHLHTSKGLGPTHYLMLGANYQSIGIYSAQDVDFSHSYPKKKERKKAEMQETLRRYRALEAKGTLILWGRKNLLNFSDGTFYWGREGNFFKEVPERSGAVAKLTRSLFHRREGSGSNHVGWSVCATSLWFGIVVLSLFAGLPKRRTESGERRTVIKAVILAVVMLILFHTLCEARARYLFCFTPLFVLIAVEGFARIFGDKGEIGRS